MALLIKIFPVLFGLLVFSAGLSAWFSALYLTAAKQSMPHAPQRAQEAASIHRRLMPFSTEGDYLLARYGDPDAVSRLLKIAPYDPDSHISAMNLIARKRGQGWQTDYVRHAQQALRLEPHSRRIQMSLALNAMRLWDELSYSQRSLFHVLIHDLSENQHNFLLMPIQRHVENLACELIPQTPENLKNCNYIRRLRISCNALDSQSNESIKQRCSDFGMINDN